MHYAYDLKLYAYIIYMLFSVCYIPVGEIKDNKLRIGTTEVDVYNPENKTKVPDVLFYENTQVSLKNIHLNP